MQIIDTRHKASRTAKEVKIKHSLDRKLLVVVKQSLSRTREQLSGRHRAESKAIQSEHTHTVEHFTTHLYKIPHHHINITQFFPFSIFFFLV